MNVRLFLNTGHGNITKHMGGLEATRKLLELCRVDNSDLVLVEGSGNGVSAIKIHQLPEA